MGESGGQKELRSALFMDSAFELLETWLTPQTLLLLSGGLSPQPLYKKLSFSTLSVGAVATVDERFGPFGHEESNERMFEETGIYGWAQKQNADIYRVLHEQSSTLEETAASYEKSIAQAFKKFDKKIAIMGIGSDGHTAGIAPGVSWWDTDRLVVGYRNSAPAGGDGWHWPERVTLTFAALRKVDKFLLLVFGQKKRKVLERLQLNEEASLQEFPAAFYLEVAAKTTIVTN